MKYIIAIVSLFICGHVWAGGSGPEECQDKFKDDMQKYYDNLNKGSSVPHTFKIHEPTEFHFAKNDEMEAIEKKAEDSGHVQNDVYIVTTHAIAHYKTPPDMEFSIKYEVNGTECNEIPNSRQFLNFNPKK